MSSTRLARPRRNAASGPIRVAVLCTIVVLAWPRADASAQIPDEFTNLQFLPEDISRDELIGVMRQFSFALGVRCQYCHFGGDGVSFEGVEFDSDEKPEKRRARYMLEMTETLNSSLLANLPERRTPSVAVQCRTCHRGLPRPRMLDDIIREKVAEEGVDAAVAEYRALREENFGGWSYDFGEWLVYDVTEEYRNDAPGVAVALLRMNAEFYPESVTAWQMLGGAEAAVDNREAAIAAYRKGLALAPDAPRLLRALRELGVDPR